MHSHLCLRLTLVGMLYCDLFPVNAADNLRDKIGVYVTPSGKNDLRFPVSYSDALETLRGHASTVWILESWSDIETAPNRYDWSSLDRRVRKASEAGFSIGLRLQIVLCGNDAHKRFVAVSRIPHFYSQDMGSPQFREKAVAFYRRVAQRYKRKARYIAVGNSVNKYFENSPSQWEGFKQSYNAIVDAIHAAAPETLVVSDISSGGEFFVHKELLQKYLDFFSRSHDDLVGLVFYFITGVYYGNDIQNMNIETLQNVLDTLHSMANGKKLYLIETASFSANPKTGKDMSALQARYVEMLLTTARQKEYIAGICWWELYDAKDLPGVSWDIKAGFGMFDSLGNPKVSWRAWNEMSAAE